MFKSNSQANEKVIIKGNCYRISILSSRLIRLEYSKHNSFVNNPTQSIINRNLPVPEFNLTKTNNGIMIETEYLRIRYNEKHFSPNGLSIFLKGNYSRYYSSRWNYSDEVKTLGGTARTLDCADGAIKLEDGLLSRDGFTILDDSKSMVFDDNGTLRPPLCNGEDLYFFGYGHAYLDCLKDFALISGKTPLIPRYALGNWQSRYFPYTESEYNKIMERYKEDDIPLSVAVIDIDWHKMQIDNKFGAPWTGYSWNKKLFPDPKQFLQDLHKRNLHTTLNLHPADGIRSFEDGFEALSKALGLDSNSEVPVEFDAADEEFWNAYFQNILYPMEKDGVDFWWIDWQQLGGSSVEGVDTLYSLNHHHYTDNCKNNNRGLTFSRFGGIGSHRYPVGFSGDTYATWASLDFQPYFTSTASNILYSWWSHDIGGHMLGTWNNERLVRWVQFGVFSPIFRLHSFNSLFVAKEPWEFSDETHSIMKEFMQLRHRLIPYIYTMADKTYRYSEPLIQPLYYKHPEDNEAYEKPNEYYFGDSMLVCPITTKMDVDTQLSRFKAWLPDGEWYDFFTGNIYKGNRILNIYRAIDSIPVFVKSGNIIPLDNGKLENGAPLPKKLEIRIYGNKGSKFSLVEDNNEAPDSPNFKRVVTDFNYSDGILSINAPEGSDEIIPNNRKYSIRFFAKINKVVSFDNTELEFTNNDDNSISFDLPYSNNEISVKVVMDTDQKFDKKLNKQAFEILRRAQIATEEKDFAYNTILKYKDSKTCLQVLQAGMENKLLFGALTELICLE